MKEACGILRRRWWAGALCIVLIPAAVYFQTSREAKVYGAGIVAQVEGAQDENAAGDVSVNPKIWSLVAYAGTAGVAIDARRHLDRRYPLGGVSATVDPRTTWLILSTTGPTAPAATESVKAYFQALLRYSERADRRLVERQIPQARRRLAIARTATSRQDASTALQQLLAVRDSPGVTARVIQGPEAVVESPHPRRNAILALILALLIAPAPMLILERLDRRLRRPSDLERLCRAPLLAALPKRAATEAGESAAATRGLERLRDSLVFLEGGYPVDVVAVVSPLAGDGRTTVATGLAISLARADRRVVLVEADLHRPDVSSRLDLQPAPGLADVISGGDLRQALQTVDGYDGELRVLTAGSASARHAEMLGSEEMSRLLYGLAEECDVVVLDTAPLLMAGDTLALVGQVSGVVAVARLNRTPRDALRRSTQMIRAAHGRLLGVVATDAKVELEDASEEEQPSPPRGSWSDRRSPPHAPAAPTR